MKDSMLATRIPLTEFDRCSHAIFHFFSKYLKTFNYKIKKIQAGGRYWFSGYVAVDRKL